MTRYALETIAAQATAPGVAGVAMTAAVGDSLRVRDSAAASLIDVIGIRQVAGSVRITSPLLHDNVVGVWIVEPISQTWMRNQTQQLLTPQDTLTLTAIGSAVAGDIELNALQIAYEDLAGIDANLISLAELRSRSVEWFSPRATITTGTTGGWSGTIAITALDDQLKANQEYAWIGMTVSTATVNVGMVGMVSPDWGNLRIACPFRNSAYELSSNYFVSLSSASGFPCIPVFNASQKSNVILTALGNENSVAIVVALNLVRLSSGKTKSGSAASRRGGC